MLAPETNDLAIALRLLGMADRIGMSEPPETIAAEAQAALAELEACAESVLRERAQLVALWLVNFVTACGPDAQEFAARTLFTVTENLRGLVSLEKRRAA